MERHPVEIGEMTLANGEVLLEMKLDGAVGLILYDRSRRVAAAGMVNAGGRGSGRRLRRRLDRCAMTLLGRLLEAGSRPGAIEVFALGPVFDPLVAPERAAISGVPGTVSMAWGPAHERLPRRVEFSVSSGRLVMEGAGGE